MLDEGPPTGPCFILTVSGMMPSPDGWGFNMGIVEEIQLTTDGRDGRDGREGHSGRGFYLLGTCVDSLWPPSRVLTGVSRQRRSS